MRRGARIRLSLLTAGAALCADAAPAQAQARPVAARGVLAQSVTVPVFPGQQLAATVLMPAHAETPVPAVLLLSIREPRSAEAPTVEHLAEALLEQGVAVVRLDLPPVSANAPPDSEPVTQPADDAYAVLQYARDREDIDGDRLALIGVGAAAEHATRAAGLDEALRALVLLAARPISRDTLDLPTGLPVLALPAERMAAAPEPGDAASPAADAAAFLSRQLQ